VLKAEPGALVKLGSFSTARRLEVSATFIKANVRMAYNISTYDYTPLEARSVEE
jgi:hypothetical protein